ncbi:response regulator transcription factor [Aquimarina sp. MMG015]|uniref:response regulator transcription factor n=1 Tax=unclassified Aquimarina TaxID=2627091 RepID=UPI000D550238|nr:MULTISPECIES: response regulator transcription factor [unclassified Aquimarina]AXT56181.1 DNA-binding response regulator [Aquimarina sp. AD1]MBQ4803722.1 response regulator transcription factor [Aquimarina sp. MMG015]RKN03818.1 DNA-binding response regulator [Aquimarina sp. AD1]
MITVAIAEDHQSLIDGIDLLLKYEEEISIIGKANDGEELLAIVRRKQPKVVLMDIRMPKIDGIAATKIIKKELPYTKIIAFSMFDQEDAVRQMVAAGASGYLLKNSPLEEVLTAIQEVMKGNTYYDASIDPSFFSEETKQQVKKQVLSKSEREILTLIGQGKTSSEIAAIRFNSVSTVETHRKNIIRKLGLQGKGELLRYAIEKKYDF